MNRRKAKKGKASHFKYFQREAHKGSSLFYFVQKKTNLIFSSGDPDVEEPTRHREQRSVLIGFVFRNFCLSRAAPRLAFSCSLLCLFAFRSGALFTPFSFLRISLVVKLRQVFEYSYFHCGVLFWKEIGKRYLEIYFIPSVSLSPFPNAFFFAPERGLVFFLSPFFRASFVY